MRWNLRHGCPRISARFRAVVFLTALGSFVAPTRNTFAAEDEHILSAAARYASVVPFAGEGDDRHGLGLSVGYRYGLTDFWGLLTDGAYAFLPYGAGVDHLGFLRFGTTYNIDATEWVPWLGLTVGVYALSTLDMPVDGGAAVGAGVDYRPARSYSVGIDFWYHALFLHLEQIPATITIGLRVSWYPGLE